MMDRVTAEGLDTVQYSRRDVLAFLFAAIGGAISYFILWKIGAPQVIKTATLVSILVLYAVAVVKTPRFRVRLDQAGDNAYYLGLLFTLMSMAVALYEFGVALADGDEERGTAAILSNFGIALATTIVGILLRVVLHQMRVDPADVESMTRIELSESAKRVKAELNTISIQIANFHDEVRQRASDVLTSLVDVTEQQLSSFGEQVTNAASSIVAEIERSQETLTAHAMRSSEAVTQFVDSMATATDRLKKVEPPPLKLATRLERVGNELEQLSDRLTTVNSHVSTTGEEFAGAIHNLTDLVEPIRANQREWATSVTESVARLDGILLKIERSIGTTNTALQTDVALVRQLEESNRQYAKSAQDAQEASKDVLRALTEVVKDITSAIRDAPR